jgi:inosose dehydratase
MFDKDHVRIGACPNAWSNDDFPLLGGNIPYQQCLDEIALAGYEGTEMGSKYPSDTAVLSDALAVRGLRMSGAWFGTQFAIEGGEQQTLDKFEGAIPFYTTLGIEDVYVAEMGYSSHGQAIPLLVNKPTFDQHQWQRVASGLERLGRVAAGHGLRIVYHHHVGTAVQTQDEVERLMDATDPRLVWLLLDTGHIAIGGGNALALAEKFADRICHVHLKNVRASALERAKADNLSFQDAIQAGIFTVPGDREGMIDFAPILDTLAARNFRGWLVVEAEQDPAVAEPLEYFTLARNYLLQTTGL